MRHGPRYKCAPSGGFASKLHFLALLTLAPGLQPLLPAPNLCLLQVPVPANQVLAIKEGLPVQQAAVHYEGEGARRASAGHAWFTLPACQLGVIVHGPGKRQHCSCTRCGSGVGLLQLA